MLTTNKRWGAQPSWVARHNAYDERFVAEVG
jgi:hypothetical protein